MRQQQPESKALEIPMTSMEIQLPSNDAVALQDKASAVGMPTARFLGVCTLLGAFGVKHPGVQAFVDETKRDNKGGNNE